MTKDVLSDKRQRIIEAAVKVFSSKGFHEAKVEEIAQIADVGKGTVYEYFSSKVELFQEILKSGMEFYNKNITEQLSASISATEKLKQVARLHLRFILEYKDLAKVTMTEHAHFGREFRSWLMKMREEKFAAIENIIKSGIDRGEIRNEVNSRAAAMVFTGMMGGLVGPAVFGDEGVQNLEDTLEQMLEILLKGLLANP
ncbi:transcriptional regulator, TetR family [Thermincola ferriacetica]|uniref:Transcriptional regulator, TetR family n=1 Tax=Thermincola ferriacetica TaxID=281456 RepID=A0A0L6W4N6_9FIRM|nr:TetR/AcrR family transcriptional regulator [Thermincola ferriacetica]KNZ70064.1 transcriptional regulator, TetR family [Thermincola ferriacetica]